MEKHPREETISAYMDGMLGVDETRRIGAHLTECDNCRSVLRSLREVKQLLRAAPSPSPLPEAFWNDTMRRMRVGDAAEFPAPVRRWGFPRYVFATAAAALALFAVVLHPGAGPLPIGTAVSAQQPDTLDTADVAQFVRQHTESVAMQPLADGNRQRMISAEIASTQIADDPSDVAADADSSL